MTEPSVTNELSQGVRDAQAKFDAGMGADGDSSPYPMINELRAQAPVHPGWPEMGILSNPEEGQQIYTAYSFDAVKAVFTDNQTFSTRCYEAIVRLLQGPTILEMQEPEHQVYRKLHEFAFARSSMRRWEAELVRPLVERTVERLRDAKRADLVEEVFMPIPVRVIAALIGLPEADIPEFHRLAIDLLGLHSDMDNALRASAQLLGAHVCLGIHLARLEMRVALNLLFDRLPDLRLDPSGDDPHIRGQVFRSPTSLPVLFESTRSAL